MQIRSRNDTRWLATSFLIALCLMTTFFSRLVTVFAASSQLRDPGPVHRAVETSSRGQSGSARLTQSGNSAYLATGVFGDTHLRGTVE